MQGIEKEIVKWLTCVGTALFLKTRIDVYKKMMIKREESYEMMIKKKKVHKVSMKLNENSLIKIFLYKIFFLYANPNGFSIL